MIRDPSDGTVKEQNRREERAPPVFNGGSPVLETKTSGLRESSGKSDYLERLNKSRDWLKNYRIETTTTE